MPDLASMHALLERGDGTDRAFVDATLRMRWARSSDPVARAALCEVHRAVLDACDRAHARQRAEIRSGVLRGDALRRVIDPVPLDRRDHFVEELLGVAYPPLDEPAPAPERMPYTPSGYDEIVHALEATGLRADQRFVDVGSGMGKVVLLAALLRGAHAIGLEENRALHEAASVAARALALPTSFVCADATELDVADADVVFMYIPFTGTTLNGTLERFMARARAAPRRRHLCASRLDRVAYPELVPIGEPRSWLQVYAWC